MDPKFLRNLRFSKKWNGKVSGQLLFFAAGASLANAAFFFSHAARSARLVLLLSHSLCLLRACDSQGRSSE